MEDYVWIIYTAIGYAFWGWFASGTKDRFKNLRKGE